MSHWRLEEKERIATLHLDVPGKMGNVLSQQVLQELDRTLAGLETRALQGLIIRSDKIKDFILGADVYEFQKIATSGRAAELTRAGQLVFARLQALPFPSVALIHGHCLGGGLELAIACTYRIAREDEIFLNPAETRLGLPEVKIGIHPGFGGSIRLPELIGDLPALDIMLSGRTLDAAEAHRLGLVDEVVPERHMMEAARRFLIACPTRRRAPWWRRLPGWPPLRPYIKRVLQRQLRKKVNLDHYPAAYRLLDLWGRAAGQEEEAVSCGELLVSRASRNLIHLFSLSEELKRAARHQPAASIEWVHVISGGLMAADIALWAAFNGFQVSLQEPDPHVMARTIKKAHRFFIEKLKNRRLVQAAMDRFMPDISGSGLQRADLVIATTAENAQTKSALFADIESSLRPETPLAIGASIASMETLAQSLSDPTRLVGLHFFHPLAETRLVEIVRGARTSEKTLAQARAFTAALKRLPLSVKGSPGYLVNRVLTPYLLEAILMVEEGVPIELIDRTAIDFGMPVGPLRLADTIGLDVCLAAAETIGAACVITVPEKLRTMTASGELGEKAGKGFYTYKKHQPLTSARVIKEMNVPIAERLILRLLNEAMACLREGVVDDARIIDVGLVYGIGFPPYLGGPMRYAEHLGHQGVRQNLSRLAQKYGPRFDPDAGWYNTELFAKQALS